MSNTIFRVGTANMYDNSIRNVSARQTSLVNLQENLTSGKRVVRASDDPVSAAQAERALTRISRIQTEQRALENQRNAIAQAESTMGDAISLVQEARQLMVSAGSGTLTSNDRATIANQLQSLRDQLTAVANRTDTNGIPLLGALGSAQSPFMGPLNSTPDYLFAGQAGQTASDGVTLPNTLDGDAAFMFDAKRDGSFHAAITPGTSTVIVPGATTPSVPAMGQPNRALTTSAITVAEGTNFNKNPATGLAYAYSVSFSNVTLDPATNTLSATYNVSSTDPAFVPPAAQTLNPIKIGEKGEFNINGLPPGMSMKVTTLPTKAVDGTITLSPANGDTINISPQASVFSVIDKAIAEIKAAPNSNVAAQASGQALANIDIGLERMSNIRSYAGELLNRADRITGDQSKRSEQLEADRSRAEDLDMIKGISDFQNQQTGYQAALQTYASVQKLSLFNYIG
ncbi:flagellar hook-associated protein FlgL [Acidovorax temperans]|uniref:flagellar hook-associated protein FlgL n=1 Tax=Acidovorax temperans TaxID=80878 RepID=UPI002897EDD7|nr:flagellar hook-associated protein FlgL [Acidovorax temperans]